MCHLTAFRTADHDNFTEEVRACVCCLVANGNGENERGWREVKFVTTRIKSGTLLAANCTDWRRRGRECVV